MNVELRIRPDGPDTVLIHLRGHVFVATYDDFMQLTDILNDWEDNDEVDFTMHDAFAVMYWLGKAWAEAGAVLCEPSQT